MGFADAVKLCFARYATFSGRSSRSEFWWWMLFSAFMEFPVEGLLKMVGGGVIASIIDLALALPTFAVAARRLHDIGRSGWWQAVFFLPPLLYAMLYAALQISEVVGVIIYIAPLLLMLPWLTRRGEPRPNAYGPAPTPPPAIP